MDLVIFPFQDWKKNEIEGFRERDSHLIQHFDRDERVGKIMVVDRPISLPEMALKRRFWRIKNGRVVKKGRFYTLSQVTAKIFVLDTFSGDILRPLVMRRDWWDFVLRHRKILKIIREAEDSLQMKNVVFFCCGPLSTGPVGQLGEKLFVFDANDNWLQHPRIQDKRGFVAGGYQFVKDKADLIFTNSAGLKDFFGDAKTSRVDWIPMGVDPEFFRVSPEDIPEDVKKVRRPIVCYNGRFAKRVNIDLFLYLLETLPQVNFVFIGQFLDKNWARPLFKFPNFHYLGNKHYSIYPKYLAAFDVCILPHYVPPDEPDSVLVKEELVAHDNKGRVTRFQDPIKLYEYLAAGKPVVTTPIAGVDVFKEQITIAGTKEEFRDGIFYWLKRTAEEPDLPERLRAAITPEHLWSTKAKKMLDAVEALLREKGI
ncbi:MAG: glycosyltransferase [Candidatus Omnitrophota bacterium]